MGRTVTALAESRLSAEEREAIITHLREFGAQQSESQQLADRGSLERAGELMRLYEDKSWMDELPAPGRRSKVAPDDFRRFTKWAVEDDRLDLKRNRITQLARANDLQCTLALRNANLQGATERALSPLRWMKNNEYADRMDEVWRDARQLSGGEAPSRDNVTRALADWKRRLPKVDKASSPKLKGIRPKVRAWETQGRSLIQEAPTEAMPVLRKLLAEFEERAAKSPLAGVS
jgi:hypothetical protein